MANRIYIDDYTRNDPDLPLSFPLIDDITPEVGSQFGSFAESIPMAEEGLNVGVAFQASTTGQVSGSLLEFKNLLDVPRWKKTDPVKFVIKLLFPLKNDPVVDIHTPMTKIIGYSILTKNDKGGYNIPGISLASMKAFQNRGEGQRHLVENAKLVCVWIPGIIYLPVAIIEKAIPLISKEITESGYPLWGQLDVSILGVYPANTDMFEESAFGIGSTERFNTFLT